MKTRKLNNLFDLFSVTDSLYKYLDGKIEFDTDGFPIFKNTMFLNEWPELVVPYSQRKSRLVTNKSKTVICSFDSDYRLYPRLLKVLEEIDEYRQFQGVIGLDITITDDMDYEWQKYIVLINQLYLAVLAVNNVKIITNTRAAGLDPYTIFKNIPFGVMCASGFLGCDKCKCVEDFSYLEKILYLLPNKLLLYGKHDPIVEKQLDTMGINYKTYRDFHTLCKEVHYGRQ